MDLNDLYFRHQLSMMQAHTAEGSDNRSRHCADARGIAGEISLFQRKAGAGAAAGWSLAGHHTTICQGAHQ
jgi:hypothetical protein